MKNHNWICERGHEIGGDYDNCPLCQLSSDNSNSVINIMNRCASCGKWFSNSPEHYELYGNYCSMCIMRLSQKEDYYLLKEHYDKTCRHSDNLKLKKMRASIFKRWHIDMLEDEKERKLFYKRINELMKIWRRR